MLTVDAPPIAVRPDGQRRGTGGRGGEGEGKGDWEAGRGGEGEGKRDRG